MDSEAQIVFFMIDGVADRFITELKDEAGMARSPLQAAKIPNLNALS
jgi:2,3-bisphosphoglycerate-independent phosphoglycerate mutase